MKPIHHARPTRGIIVVDTSSLARMCVPLSAQYLTDDARLAGKQVRLSDALTLLSKHGYEIIIPEMVAHECGGHLRDGSSIHEYFPKEYTLADYQHHFKEGVEDEAIAQSKQHTIDVANIWREFFHPVLGMIPGLYAAGHNIRIEQPPAHDTSSDANFVRNLWRIHKQTGTAGTKLDLQSEKRMALKAIFSAYDYQSQRGDNAALTYFKSLRKAAVPVFYLSDDSGAHAAAAQIGPINQVNYVGIYNALEKHGLLQEIGIKPAAFSAELATDIRDGFEAAIGPTYLIQHETDFAPGETPENHSAYPFATSMNRLKEEIAPNQIDIPMEAVTMPSRVDKFKRRYEKWPGVNGNSGNGSNTRML